MRDQNLRSATKLSKFLPAVFRLRLPTWVLVSLVANAVLVMALLIALMRQTSQSVAQTPPASQLDPLAVAHPSDPVAAPAPAPAADLAAAPDPSMGERHQFTYEQWLNQLSQEARVAAEQQPDRLTILAGDSISLWFPSELLPVGRTWLNQGISGETSAGLLKRLDLFADTRPETIFVLIGINDLLREVDDATLLENQRQIIQTLQAQHPGTQIVVQSILPRAKESSWEGRDRLLAVSNARIQNLNQQLEAMARQSGVYFLDLYPLFANPEGDLRPELSTDGLHLSNLGYQTWSIALQVYGREVLNYQ